MKLVFRILVLLVICIVCFASFQAIIIQQRNQESPIIQQLIERQVELEIIVAEQSSMIQLQAMELTKSEESINDIFQTAIEVASENHSLKKIIAEMSKAMEQMLEHIQKLEGDNDA